MKLLPILCFGGTLLVFALCARATSVDPSEQDPAGNAGQPVAAPMVLLGDADGNGKVNASDYMALKRNIGKTSGAVLSSGDFDYDGDVDWVDLQLLAESIMTPQAIPPVTAVPEPLTMGLLALGIAAIGGHVKRRLGKGQTA